jgi:hypothetical protein
VVTKAPGHGLTMPKYAYEFYFKKISLVISSGCPPSITGNEKYIQEFLRVFGFSKCFLFIDKTIY